MGFAKVFSAQHHLLKAEIVSVEVDLARGLHAFSIVGLPDKGVEESRDRVSAAIKNSGFPSPKSKNQKVVVSLAPADLRKEGPIFDLAIALAYLLASNEISFDPSTKLFLGELSLDGKLRRIRGVLPQVTEARAKGFTEVYVPIENAVEASLIEGIAIFAVSTLQEIVSHLDTKRSGAEKVFIKPFPQTKMSAEKRETGADLSDIQGQEVAKRGLEIAAAGGHSIMLHGPPGTGKTLLAKAFAYLLPPLSFEETLEVTSIHSSAGLLHDDLILYPPFRTPHHTISRTSLIGGGSSTRPGEITLAHRGILFLDEFPEFHLEVITTLRQPLEEGVIHLTRNKYSFTYPAHFILIATMNPCPCGNLGATDRVCTCGPKSIERYRKKLSSPIIDRIDIWIEVPTLDKDQLLNKRKGYTTDEIQKRVSGARLIQKERFNSTNLQSIQTNSEMGPKEIESLIHLNTESSSILHDSVQKLNLSMRSYHRILKLSRTIADLDSSKEIETKHVLEALQYRLRQKD